MKLTRTKLSEELESQVQRDKFFMNTMGVIFCFLMILVAVIAFMTYFYGYGSQLKIVNSRKSLKSHMNVVPNRAKDRPYVSLMPEGDGTTQVAGRAASTKATTTQASLSEIDSYGYGVDYPTCDRSWKTSIVDGTVSMFSLGVSGATLFYGIACIPPFLATMGVTGIAGIGASLATCCRVGVFIAVANCASYVVSSHRDNGGWNYDTE